VATLDGHKGLVRDLHPLLVAGQHLLLSCGYDKTIRVWAAASDSLAAGAAGALE
jgi:WD40 repeat protein